MGDFGNRLKRIRKAKKITQNNLAKNIHVAQSTIANYENNIRFPGSDKLKQISDYLDVSIDYLLGLTDVSGIEASGTKKEYDFQKDYENLVNLLLAGKVEEAKTIIKDISENGVESIDLIEKVFIPVLKIIGDKWEENKIDIFEERYVSEAIEKLFAYVSLRSPLVAKKEFTALFMVPPGEEHIISLRMSTEYFNIRGWNIRFIGRSIPANSLMEMIKKEKIDLLVLSTTMPQSANTSSYIVETVKANLGDKSPKILLGGGKDINLFNKNLIESFVDYHVENLPDLSLKIDSIEKDILKN